MILTVGVPGVFLLNYATKDLFLHEKEETPASEAQFRSEYDELMWLAEKEKHAPLSEKEMLRFYELRDKWPEMHADCQIQG